MRITTCDSDFGGPIGSALEHELFSMGKAVDVGVRVDRIGRPAVSFKPKKKNGKEKGEEFVHAVPCKRHSHDKFAQQIWHNGSAGRSGESARRVSLIIVIIIIVSL